MSGTKRIKPSVFMALFVFCSALFGMKVLADESGGRLAHINSVYQALLDEHLSAGHKNGLPAIMVDYSAVKKDERLKQLTQMLQDYPKELLDTREKKLAFYLNAYNILAIAKVVKHWPLTKLKALGTFYKPVWTHPVGEVCGDKMTLRKLEHQILRALDEPRVHFAINCASMSCPNLRSEPYDADNIESQLADQTFKFLAQEGKGATIEGSSVRLSRLFDWFAKDFDSSGGVRAFVERYMDDLPDGWELDSYLEYDWTVNDHLTSSELNKIKRSGNNTWFN